MQSNLLSLRGRRALPRWTKQSSKIPRFARDDPSGQIASLRPAELASARNDGVRDAIAVLKKGGVVVFPTETAYGLAADPRNKRAMRRVYLIKGREKTKNLPLIATNLSMAVRYAKPSPVLVKLARKHWPGPLTIVGKKAAIRVSSHPVARALSRGLGRPIVSTSANVSGKPPCYSIRAVKKQFAPCAHQPDYYLDVGVLPRRKPSTLVKEEKGRIVVLRQGSIHIPSFSRRG